MYLNLWKCYLVRFLTYIPDTIKTSGSRLELLLLQQQQQQQSIMDNETSEINEDHCYVGLTRDHLNLNLVADKVRSPQAGAIVMFAGKLPSHTSFPLS